MEWIKWKKGFIDWKMETKHDMKRINIFTLLISFFCASTVLAQETPIASNFKHIRISAPGNVVYSKALILLHPMYDGTDLANNYAVGHLTARRGGATAYNRLNTVLVNTSAAYRGTSGLLSSFEQENTGWRLKACHYNGVKYLAVDVPYRDGQHTQGFQFAGWLTSSGESMKFVVYEVSGVAQNTDVLTDIQDFEANINSTQQVKSFNVLGKVGIGTISPTEALSVNGHIRAKEIKVEAANWPDYVFKEGYDIKSLTEVEAFIRKNGHLPDIPKASDVQDEGVSLGEMNKLLLKKVEELTLHLIEKEKEMKEMQTAIKRVDELEKKMKKIQGALEGHQIRITE